MFWGHLGGKSEYPPSAETRDGPREPRLFHLLSAASSLLKVWPHVTPCTCSLSAASGLLKAWPHVSLEVHHYTCIGVQGMYRYHHCIGSI